MIERVVVDSSAVIAFIRADPGGAAVGPRLPGAYLTAVNYSEVLAKLAGYGVPIEEVSAYLESVRVEIVPVDQELGRMAAALMPLTKGTGLSLGDRICLAAAQRLKAPVVTMDLAWAGLKIDVRVEVARLRRR